MTAATEQPRPFRFFDNREKYLLFTTTCNEKHETARRIGLEFRHLRPRPPALRVFQAGSGEGTILNMVLRQLHHRWPHVAFLVVVKEMSPEILRVALRTLADRFAEHPELVMVFTNLRYGEATALRPKDQGASARLIWHELALTGDSAHAFETQINAELRSIHETWQVAPSPTSGRLQALNPAVMVVYRADQKFVLDRVIPRADGELPGYDLVIASQPYPSRATATRKLDTVLAPLAAGLAPGGRMIAVQAKGDDPGLEIIQGIWPGEQPFSTPRAELMRALGERLARQRSALRAVEPPTDEAEFRYALQLNPGELESSIGTSTLLAAWNAAAYVAQIDDQRLAAAMGHGDYLEATRRVLREHDGLWFNNECFLVERPAEN